MIFLTVGTQFPFDRLVKAIDDLCERGLIHEPVVAQIGNSEYRPRHFEAVTSLDKSAFDRNFQQASAIIGHAGMGTITMALESSKPLLVMPRRKKYGEVVNDHQVVLAIKFEALGHILLARDETELADKIERLKSFVPRLRKADPDAVTRRISAFLGQV
jgi:UDP-N-acetylglucosamine transferase subunit ALG13